MNFSNFRSGAIFTSATYTSREWVLIKFIHCDLIFEFPRKIMEYVIFASAFVRISFGLPQPRNASISWHYDGTQLVNTQSNVSITAVIHFNSFSFTQFKFIFNCFLLSVNVLLCKSTSPFFCYLWVWRRSELSAYVWNISRNWNKNSCWSHSLLWETQLKTLMELFAKQTTD